MIMIETMENKNQVRVKKNFKPKANLNGKTTTHIVHVCELWVEHLRDLCQLCSKLNLNSCKEILKKMILLTLLHATFESWSVSA